MISLSRGAAFIFFLLLVFPIQAADLIEAEKIDVNTALEEELQKITGVGPAIAQRIIDARPFSSIHDLIRVNGIGEITLQKIIDQGLAWVAYQPGDEVNASSSPVGESPQQYPEGVVINEILPSPEGADAEKEWIEIFNQNNFGVNLSGWQITDSAGETQNYTFPEGSTIGPEGFFLLFRPMTRIVLNNGGDELKLLRPDGGNADSLIYENAPNGESFNRTLSGWTWSSHLTPGEINSISLPEKSEEETPEETKDKKGLATVSQVINLEGNEQNQKMSFPFIAALSLAVFSGLVILNLKKKISF